MHLQQLRHSTQKSSHVLCFSAHAHVITYNVTLISKGKKLFRFSQMWPDWKTRNRRVFLCTATVLHVWSIMRQMDEMKQTEWQTNTTRNESETCASCKVYLVSYSVSLQGRWKNCIWLVQGGKLLQVVPLTRDWPWHGAFHWWPGRCTCTLQWLFN